MFAHIETLEGYGLSAEFRFDGTAKMIEDEIRAGRPVMVGWLHRGPIEQPTGIGHWSVIVGFNREEFIMHDPAGEPRLIEGGHVNGGGRDVQSQPQSIPGAVANRRKSYRLDDYR